MLQGGATSISGDPNQIIYMQSIRSAFLFQLRFLREARLASNLLAEFIENDGYRHDQHGTLGTGMLAETNGKAS